MTTPNLMNRRSFLRKGLKVGLSLLGIGMIGAYPFIGERFWYQIKEVHLTVRNLPKAYKGWKIVQFSDVHFGFHYGVDEFRRVVKMINRLQPDIIFFTGDLVNTKYESPELAIPLLQELSAPRGGKWAVLGNHDYMTRAKVIKTLESSQFKLLVNQHSYIEFEGQRLYIAGIDDVMYGNYSIEEAVQTLSAQDCVLFLAHEPDIAELSSTYNISAQFSGHSHGGQIRLPFFGPLFTNKMAEQYDDGLYTVGENKMPVYVNRGIGTTNLPIRFFCRPEITVFYLS
ncbi:metallophosphoesterase [Paenibacillus radicis (ex Xue et al. 2023)]|uniref:Metallophosphoesterase n=1 Tax=Paenibacillus radicis (ex Xue et al. 2023) TaxID=2972489 RepID=A0ABT1YQG2_9BACL|nr:metallophosphoesterase [Paenibacillus radicis (ex Xue et al. 2023)]MCR8635421.1 metallophosphoesterase [Paenibacillus radicis (ex Xue et al. 2023)]